MQLSASSVSYKNFAPLSQRSLIFCSKSEIHIIAMVLYISRVSILKLLPKWKIDSLFIQSIHVYSGSILFWSYREEAEFPVNWSLSPQIESSDKAYHPPNTFLKPPSGLDKLRDRSFLGLYLQYMIHGMRKINTIFKEISICKILGFRELAI